MKEPYNILKDEDIDKAFDNLYNLIDKELEEFETANNVAAKKFSNEETPSIVNHLLFFRAHFWI